MLGEDTRGVSSADDTAAQITNHKESTNEAIPRPNELDAETQTTDDASGDTAQDPTESRKMTVPGDDLDRLRCSQPQNILASPGQNSLITLMDSEENVWYLPFENVRTWEGFKKTIKSIFKDDNWPIDDDKSDKTRIAIDDISSFEFCDKLFGRYFVPEHWEQLIHPGMFLSVYLKYPKPEKEEPEEEKPEAPVTYSVEVWQREQKGSFSHLKTKTLVKSPTWKKTTASADSNTESVLCEVTQVWRSESKKGQDPEKMAATEFDDGDAICPPILHIHSSFLLNALRTVIEYQNVTDSVPVVVPQEHENAKIVGLTTGRFPFPYTDLYHNIGELLKYKSSGHRSRTLHGDEYNKKCDDHIDVLDDFLRGHPKVAVKDIEAMWSRDTPVTTFNVLWMLFKPGEDIYVREGKFINKYVLNSVANHVSKTNEPTTVLPSLLSPYVIIEAWNLNYDGEKLGRSLKVFTIPRFEGEREIDQLKCYPIRFHRQQDGQKAFKEVLVDRGKKFARFAKGSTYQEYTGICGAQGLRNLTRARVVIDHGLQPWTWMISKGTPVVIPQVDSSNVGLSIRTPRCECSVCEEELQHKPHLTHQQRPRFADYDDLQVNLDKMTDHQYSLCDSHVFGYILNDRTWEILAVEGLTDPEIHSNVIDKLVMRPESTKDMIKGICETYSDKVEGQKAFFADFIQSKGEGQIFLLHGPPGTGKTLTAESIAEFTRKPLLSITAADLGDEADVLERNLLQLFRWASKWDAIVLLDEADVYFERRSNHDLTRNGVVSAFLRALDYFKGILFLTTNRVGSVDEAFLSRIHVSIQYDALDDDARQRIWENNFDKLELNHENGGKELRVQWSAKEYVKNSPEIQSLHWNGREIRNAIQTAVALASADAKKDSKNEKEPIPVVKDKHIMSIVAMSLQFKKYMLSTLRDSDSAIAAKANLRADKHTVTPKK